ncbi:hypothetical protein HMPREF0541_00337 [Lacticaseibacillus rhamnosus ATCC 21052]|nr:hypothetical protein HMPREF0541_00337 [Lacticaseibacillus rhamnosus ATCC 21052]
MVVWILSIVTGNCMKTLIPAFLLVAQHASLNAFTGAEVCV